MASPQVDSPLPIQSWTPPSTGYRWGYCTVDHSLGIGVDDGENTENEASLLGYRAQEGRIFGLTPPPTSSVRIAGDYEPTEALILAYPGIQDYDDVFSDIIEATWNQGGVQVLIARQHRSHFAALMRSRDIPPGSVTMISNVPFNTVWMRDYGPQAVITNRGIAFVDGRYFVNCLNDDSVPTHFARRRRRAQVYRPDLWTEGGNLISNGLGLCVTSTYLTTQNGKSEAEVSAITRAYYGCEQTIFLDPLVGNVVSHVDMFLYFASEDVILLGQYTPTQDPDNHFVLETTLHRLAALRTARGTPYTIIRVPMPDSLVGDPSDLEGPLVRSYLNMLAFNEVVLVPIYDTDTTIEVRAFNAIQRAFPDRMIFPIIADAIAGDHGTVHCITQTIPRY